MDPAELLHEIERFLARTGMTPTEFGREALGDPVFVRDLRAGREPRRRTWQRLVAFMAKHKAAA